MNYKTTAEAEHRLSNTYFLYKGKLAYCAGIGGRGPNSITVRVRSCVNGQPKFDDNVNINSDDLQIKGLKFGYFNEGCKAWYMMRMPQRHPQQGLTWASILAPPNLRYEIDGVGEIREARRENLMYLFQHQGFEDMLNGKYPTVGEAFDKIREGSKTKSVAFSRNLSMEVDELEQLILRYKGRKVAVSSALDALEFRLPAKFQQLKELISEHRELKIA